MSDIHLNTQSLLAFLAKYVQLTTSEEKLAACEALLGNSHSGTHVT